MNDCIYPVKVVFRKWDNGNIEALMPYEAFNDNLCTSYARIGQHSSADYSYCMSVTKPALPKEYAALKKELESIGYKVTVIKRRTFKK